MENNRSIGMKKAYANGNRIKSVCTICGKGIYNRMVYKDDFWGDRHCARLQYAHTSCAKKAGWKFELCW